MKAFEVFILIRHAGMGRYTLRKMIVACLNMPSALSLNLRENEEMIEARELQGYSVIVIP